MLTSLYLQLYTSLAFCFTFRHFAEFVLFSYCHLNFLPIYAIISLKRSDITMLDFFNKKLNKTQLYNPGNDLDFLELLKEPIIKQDYKNDIDNLISDLGNTETNYKYSLGILMNKVFHAYGLQITKWDNDNNIYFTIPASYDSNYFIFNNPAQLAKYFKSFMTWCLENGAGSTSEWTDLYGQFTSFTCRYKIRENECWDKLKYITAKIAIISELG